ALLGGRYYSEKTQQALDAKEVPLAAYSSAMTPHYRICSIPLLQFRAQVLGLESGSNPFPIPLGDIEVLTSLATVPDLQWNLVVEFALHNRPPRSIKDSKQMLNRRQGL